MIRIEGGGGPNATTRQAQEDTVLSPRFYTTDFDELDRTDVTAVRAEWDELIAELRADPNKDHFKRSKEWESELREMPEPLRKEFIEFLVSSVTAEFSGCVLYAEMKKRGFSRVIESSEPNFYWLPNGTYYRVSSSTREQVR